MGRATIRTAVKTAITNSGAFGSGKVFTGKLDAVAAAQMPCAVIYTGEDLVEAIALGNPRRFEHTLTIHVEIYARAVGGATTSAEEALDALCVAVETAIHTDTDLSSACDNCYVSRINYDLSGEAGNQYGCAQMELTATWTVKET